MFILPLKIPTKRSHEGYGHSMKL